MKNLSRRSFLKLSALALGSLTARSLPSWYFPDDPFSPIGIGRVTFEMIRIYAEPDFASERVGKLWRDTLVWLYEEFDSPHGPPRNPLWYRVENGYVHSAYLQRVEHQRINLPLAAIPPTGILGEITVPFSPTFRFTRSEGWQPLYRLYYQSVHWITGLDEGPDGEPWYRLTDYLLYVDYHVRAAHVRPIPPEEYRPLHPEVPAEDKRLAISVQNQTITAFEGDQAVYHKKVSTGLPSGDLDEGELPTDTPIGSFRIQTKMPSRHMGEGKLTSVVGAYELPGVPWTMIFHETGVALHGTFWHNNFGARMSHGCVNLRNEDAKWLFRWTDPVFDPSNWYMRQPGTRVQIFE